MIDSQTLYIVLYTNNMDLAMHRNRKDYSLETREYAQSEPSD